MRAYRAFPRVISNDPREHCVISSPITVRSAALDAKTFYAISERKRGFSWDSSTGLPVELYLVIFKYFVTVLKTCRGGKVSRVFSPRTKKNCRRRLPIRPYVCSGSNNFLSRYCAAVATAFQTKNDRSVHKNVFGHYYMTLTFEPTAFSMSSVSSTDVTLKTRLLWKKIKNVKTLNKNVCIIISNYM